MKRILFVLSFFTVVGLQSFAQKAHVFTNDHGAINGYDPVAYFTVGKAVKGSSNYALKWNDATWYFTSDANLKEFKMSPEKYAPQYGGYCAYACSEGHKAPTDPNAFTVVDGKLYLNYNGDVKKKWMENQKERIDKANKNWPQIMDKE